MPNTSPTRRHAVLTCVFVSVTALVAAGLLVLAALTPVPAAALPLVLAVCTACPVAAGCELRPAIRDLRRLRLADADRRALEALRRQLEALPETPHPLGH